MDRDGTVYGTDKSMVLHGRAVWLFSRLCNALGENAEWLEAARHGYTFLFGHGFDAEGSMVFSVDRRGAPLGRMLFSVEAYATMAAAEYARAAGDKSSADLADKLLGKVFELHQRHRSEGVVSSGRRVRKFLVPLLLLTVGSALRGAGREDAVAVAVQRVVDEICEDFIDPREHVVYETVGLEAAVRGQPEGRCMVPGHAINLAWLFLEESERTADTALRDKALHVLDCAFERGWDDRYGGIFQYVDTQGKPPEDPGWAMKLWWVHNEALYATLLAHAITGAPKYCRWFDAIHEWTFAHFPDSVYGGWYGYLNRDGTVALRAKGTMWKGVFHVSSSLLQCHMLLRSLGGG